MLNKNKLEEHLPLSSRLSQSISAAFGLFSAFARPVSSLELLRKSHPDAPGAKRHFLITEVTRMTSASICIAAIDLQRLTVVRLLQWNKGNWPIDLVGNGLRPGNIVRGCTKPVQAALGFPHATEDLQLAADFAIRDSISEADLYNCLIGRVDGCVAAIFEGNVHEKRYVIDGTHCRSLGSVLVDSSATYLKITAFGKSRLGFKDAAGQGYELPVTDFGVAGNPVATAAGRLAAAKAHNERLLLRVGLARGFDGFGKFAPKRCYMQVNGIIFSG